MELLLSGVNAVVKATPGLLLASHVLLACIRTTAFDVILCLTKSSAEIHLDQGRCDDPIGMLVAYRGGIISEMRARRGI